MPLKHGLLGFLSEGEQSGYDLEKMFSRSIGLFWNAKISQVYRDLHTMEKLGWIESENLIQTGRPNKRIYRIMDAGYEELDNWLINYKAENDMEIRMGILMRMFFAARRPRNETIALLERFRIKCQEALAELSSVRQNIDQYDTAEVMYSKMTLSYGEKYYQMSIEWSTETIENLQRSDEIIK